MSISVGRYVFEGPYTSTAHLQDRAGVYAIHCQLGGVYTLVDVGESATLKTRVESHDRQDCWKRNCAGTLTASALYTPHLQQSGRMEIEQELRAQFAPTCGVR